MGLEGELRIGLVVRDARIECVGITSTRPDVARSLLQGRPRAEVVAAVPRIFSICAQSQGVASRLACAAAAGEELNGARWSAGTTAVAAEMIGEYAWRTLLEAPQAIGETAGDKAVAAARAALALVHSRADVAPQGDSEQMIAIAVFGVAAGEWLAWRDLAAFDRWADAGATASARFVRQLRDEDEAGRQSHADDAGAGGGGTEPACLPGQQHAEWIGELSEACDADPSFAQAPSWRGAPAETGALARQQREPLIAALWRRSATRVPVRFVARLRELALLLAGRFVPVLGALALPHGGGIAWVENARGLLVHQVRLDNHRVRTYRIVAPTEWNFCPGGALASALLGTAATDLLAVRRHAQRVVQSLDPCVACRVEFDHA